MAAYRFFGAFPPGAFLPTFFPPVAFLATPFPPVVLPPVVRFAGAFPPVTALALLSLPFLGLLGGGAAITSSSDPLDSSSTGMGSLLDDPFPFPAFRIDDRRVGGAMGDEASPGVLGAADGAVADDTDSEKSGAEKSKVALCFAARGSPVRPSPKLRSAGYISQSPLWDGTTSRLSCGLNSAMGIEAVSRIGRVERNMSTCRGVVV